MPDGPFVIRINKYISLCGVTSRRGADRLIEEGRVTLNDSTVDQLGTIIDEKSDSIKVDGAVVRPITKQIYIIFNKPSNVMTTLHDPFKRRTVLYYLKSLSDRVFPVGRLDYDTQGVLMMTNDGDLAFRLSHPRYKIPKIYEALVQGEFTPENVAAFEKGISLEDGAIGHARADILERSTNRTRLRLVLTEGRKREIKQLCKSVGCPVKRLRRLKFAGLDVSGLAPGKWRHLTDLEVKKLKIMVRL